MPKFIKLTRKGKQEVYLNTDYIIKVYPSINGEAKTVVTYSLVNNFDSYQVLETAEEVLAKIEGKAYVK